MRNASWTEKEQMKVVWNIVDSELLFKTKARTQERKQVVELIAEKLLNDDDFSERHNAQDPKDTIRQHIVAWIGYLEGRREDRPPLIR